MRGRRARGGVEGSAAIDDAMVAIHTERGHENGLKQQGHGAGIRCRIGLTRPRTKAGMRNSSAMVMGNRLRIGMVDDTRHGEQRQDQIESCQRCRTAGKRCRSLHHGMKFCTARTALGASQSRGPTARPINIPCWSMNTVVGSARTR